MPPPFLRIRTGLLEPQHVQALGGGSPFVLYVWLHSRVRFSDAGAGTTYPTKPYHHDDAAQALGAPRTSVRRWFRALLSAGYITTSRGTHGLVVTITKYEAAECPPMDSQRVSTDGQSDGSVSVHQWPSECPPVAQRVSTHGHSANDATRSAREKLDTRDIQESHPLLTERDARAKRTPLQPAAQSVLRPAPKPTPQTTAPQPHQAVVDAWLTAVGRDPAAAKDYGRYVAVGAEMAGRGDTPQDVGNCTRYLATDPWRQEKSKAPGLGDVRDALPMWRDSGRPARMTTKTNGQQQRPPSGQEYLRQQLALTRRQGAQEAQEVEDAGGRGAGPKRLPGGAVEAGHHAE